MSHLSQIISIFPFFTKFNSQEIEIFSKYLVVEKFSPQQVLMKKGESGNHLCIILSGKVKITDQDITLAIRVPGDVLGEMALITSSPRSADVVAVTEGEIAIMSYSQIEKFKLEQPALALKLITILTETTIEKLHETEKLLRVEKEKSDRLLLNILPQEIAERLKNSPQPIADYFEKATILFADIVGFTPLSARLSPGELINLLNQVFSSFDVLAEHYGLEKIKTIGDAYMIAGGLPIPRPDHTEAIAEIALDMKTVIQQFQSEINQPFQVRIGINTGPVVAGVIGMKKFIYDLWGDTVNVASRMESSGIPGRIQVTETVYEKLKKQYIFEPRGEIIVKGKGLMNTYWLVGRKRTIS